MTSIIVTSLLKTGPCLSSVLVEEMLKTSGVNRDTARKQISRAASAGQIHCVDKLFPKRERFIYLKQEYGTGASGPVSMRPFLIPGRPTVSP